MIPKPNQALWLRDAFYACVFIWISYLGYRTHSERDAKLKTYIEKASDPSTRQEAQVEYFGHDVTSPEDVIDDIVREAWHLREYNAWSLKQLEKRRNRRFD